MEEGSRMQIRDEKVTRRGIKFEDGNFPLETKLVGSVRVGVDLKDVHTLNVVKEIDITYLYRESYLLRIQMNEELLCVSLLFYFKLFMGISNRQK